METNKPEGERFKPCAEAAQLLGIEVKSAQQSEVKEALTAKDAANTEDVANNSEVKEHRGEQKPNSEENDGS
ncbi:MAG: hypothetical protein ACYC6N_03965 [Pirellulaceae bacterium]